QSTREEVTEQIAVLATKSVRHQQLFGTAIALECRDFAELGKEFVNHLLQHFEGFFRGEFHPQAFHAFAEALTASRILSDPDAARLRVLVAELAFDLGYSPAELTEMARALPTLGRVLGGTPDWLQQLYRVWRLQEDASLPRTGRVETVFEFARRSPATSGRTLAQEPDLYFLERFDSEAESILGTMMIARRGISVAGVLMADPASEVVLVPNPAGPGAVLLLGVQRVALQRRPSNQALALIRAWLAFRGREILAEPDASATRLAPRRLVQLLRPLMTHCRECQTATIAVPGQLGIRWEFDE
ncbi:MAG: hypothetical protein ACRCZF_07515, partial [Gemmataceae bacterium]